MSSLSFSTSLRASVALHEDSSRSFSLLFVCVMSLKVKPQLMLTATPQNPNRDILIKPISAGCRVGGSEEGRPALI